MRKTYALTIALSLGMALVWSAAAWAGEEGGAGRTTVSGSKRLSLEQTVGEEVYRQAGLAKLTPEEQRALTEWVRDYTSKIVRYVEEQCKRDQQAPPAKP
jgi:hypothetical protein